MKVLFCSHSVLDGFYYRQVVWVPILEVDYFFGPVWATCTLFQVCYVSHYVVRSKVTAVHITVSASWICSYVENGLPTLLRKWRTFVCTWLVLRRYQGYLITPKHILQSHLLYVRKNNRQILIMFHSISWAVQRLSQWYASCLFPVALYLLMSRLSVGFHLITTSKVFSF
jgi:hypothetical protein